jgi:hypothetical protein
MSEADLDRNIKQLAAWLRLYAYHTHDSRRSPRGFPDWVIAGPGGVIFRECKSLTGTLTVDQRAWLRALASARADVSVWRPGDWHNGRIRRELERLAEATGAGGCLPPGTGAGGTQPTGEEPRHG